MDTLTKVGAGIVTAGVLAGGGSVALDTSINPYETVAVVEDGKSVDTLQIAAESTIEDAGEVKTIVNTDTPRIELQRWDGEVALGITSLDLPADTTGARPFLSKNVEWQSPKATMEAVPLEPAKGHEDGGMEININLPAKPASNVFTFQLDNWENLDFFYQAPLTQEEIDEGASRPENVVGSYAVYYKNHANHIEGQTNYATGKAYHIYRPLVTDADGKTTWADLFIDGGVLTVTVPQSFLNSAAYPVVVDPTFGYTTNGGTELNEPTNVCFGRTINLVNQVTANTGDTVTSFSVYAYASSTMSAAMAAYQITAGVPTNQLSSASTSVSISTTLNWYSSSAVSQVMTAGNTYGVAFTLPGITGSLPGTSEFFDAGSAPGRLVTTDGTVTGCFLTSTFGAVGTDSGRHYSWYATYTSAATTPAKVQINTPVIINSKTELN